MSESDRASFAAFDVEFVVEISRCRAPLHRSTTEALRPAADVELYSSTALSSSTALQRSTLYILYTLPQSRVHAVKIFSDLLRTSYVRTYLPKVDCEQGFR